MAVGDTESKAGRFGIVFVKPDGLLEPVGRMDTGIKRKRGNIYIWRFSIQRVN